MTDPVPIRLARSPDIPQMQAIEIAAGRLFAEIGMHDVAEDGAAHLEQMTVHLDQARRGIGSRLVDAFADWARDHGLTAMTLLTFRDVAWNGPYYRRLGFVDLPDTALGPELAALREHEAEIGLDVSIRGAMRLPLR